MNVPRRPRINFNSTALHASMLEHAYKSQPRWFDLVAYAFREEFALKYATKTWNVSPTGNPVSIVVSYPRPNGKVRIYDLDSGEFYWVKLTLFTKTRISGRAKSSHYEVNDVMMDDQRPESEDIQDQVNWEYIEEFDKSEGRVSHAMISKREAGLIALPRSTRSGHKRE